YPGAPGRTGYAVGLDVPASVVALLGDLAEAGYTLGPAPSPPEERESGLNALRVPSNGSDMPVASSKGRIELLERGEPKSALSLETYRDLLASLPSEARARMHEAWGEPETDPDAAGGALRFRAKNFGNVLVAVAPDRGRSPDRRAEYHDA